MLSDHDLKRIEAIINAALADKLGKMCEFMLATMQQLAKEIAECQMPLVQGVSVQHRDLTHVIKAVADLQQAQTLLIQKLESINGEPDDNWWKGEKPE